MSTLKVDALSSKSTDTDLAITADGSGLVDIETGFKVSGTAGVPTADIRADAITGAKIADDAIDSEHYVDGSIDEAHIADDAVTLAKMAAGTDGNIISYDASGNPVAVATGTDGQVLTSSGAGQPPAFEAAAGGGGAWNIIGTAVASDSASLTVTGLDSTYDTYAIGFSDMVPATSHTGTRFRVGDSSGVDSASGDYNYYTSTHKSFDGGGITHAADESADHINLADSTDNNAGSGFGGMLYLNRPGDGTSGPMVSGTFVAIKNTMSNSMCHVVAGNRSTVITLDRVNVSFISGNITSGRMTVWGIAHA